MFFFFKPKTAYEMRISDWSSDVCSSDLEAILQAKAKGLPVVVSMGSLAASGGYWVSTAGDAIFAEPNTITGSIGIFGIIPTFENRSEERRVGKECVSKRRSRW